MTEPASQDGPAATTPPGRAGVIENLCRRVTVHALCNAYLQLIPGHYAGLLLLAGIAASTTWPWSCGGMPARTF